MRCSLLIPSTRLSAAYSPSFWNSLHDPAVYPDPDAFKPERWLEGGDAVESDPKNYLVVRPFLSFVFCSCSPAMQYGSGPHRCIGYEYANMHIAAVLGTAAMLMDWQHEVTPESSLIKCVAPFFLVAPDADVRVALCPRRFPLIFSH